MAPEKQCETQDGKKFEYFQVNRILKNVKYIGLIEYDGKIYPGKHEPIISKEDFETVQRISEKESTTIKNVL